jgi:hypothetical protein
VGGDGRRCRCRRSGSGSGSGSGISISSGTGISTGTGGESALVLPRILLESKAMRLRRPQTNSSRLSNMEGFRRRGAEVEENEEYSTYSTYST